MWQSSLTYPSGWLGIRSSRSSTYSAVLILRACGALGCVDLVAGQARDLRLRFVMILAVHLGRILVVRSAHDGQVLIGRDPVQTDGLRVPASLPPACGDNYRSRIARVETLRRYTVQLTRCKFQFWRIP